MDELSDRFENLSIEEKEYNDQEDYIKTELDILEQQEEPKKKTLQKEEVEVPLQKNKSIQKEETKEEENGRTYFDNSKFSSQALPQAMSNLTLKPKKSPTILTIPDPKNPSKTLKMTKLEYNLKYPKPKKVNPFCPPTNFITSDAFLNQNS